LTEIGEYGFQFAHNAATDLLKIRHQNSAGAVDLDDIMVWKPNGNVGIGTNTPESLLHLSAAVSLDNSDPLTLKLHNTTSDTGYDITKPWAKIEFDTDETNGPGSGRQCGIGARYEQSAGNGTALGFYTTDDVNNDTEFSTTNERMTIDHDGNVGIGTTTPDFPLTIQETTTNTNTVTYPLALRAISSGTVDDGFGVGLRFQCERRDTDDYNGLAGSVEVYGTNIPGTGDRWNMRFGVRNDDTAVTPMTLQYDGNVGIGTTSPATPFHINKLTATTGPLAHTTTEFIRIRGDKVNGSTYAISGGIKLGGDTGGTATADGRIEFYANDGAGVSNDYGDIPDNLIMCMRGDGNVGIGTATPTTALDVVGTVTATAASITGTSDGVFSVQNTTTPTIARMLTTGGQVFFQSGIAATSDSRADINFTSIYNVTNYLKIQGSTGNVGIGLTNPSKMLHTKGEVVVGTDADNFTNQKGSLYFIRGAGRATTGFGDRHHYISTRTDGTANGGSGNNMIFHVDDGTTTDGTSHATPLKLTGDGGVEIGGWKTKTWRGNMAGSGANTNINIIDMVSSGTSGQRGEITGELTVMVNRGGGNQQRALYKVWLNHSKWGSTWYGSTVVLYSSQTGWTGITSVAMTGGNGTDNNIGVRIIGNTNTTGQYYIKFEGPLYVPT